MNKEYQLSILIPSAHPDKLNRLIDNLRFTMSRFDETEIVICQDGDESTEKFDNFVWCYSPPSKFRSTFHEKPMLEASGRFMMMANDDIEFKTKNWDLMIPYHLYPDDFVLFHFKDDIFNQNFACHPVFSRKTINLRPDILSPLYQITKCDNTIWDIHPASRRIYLPEIEIIHHHDATGDSYNYQAYRDDNSEYAKNQEVRDEVRRTICKEIGMDNKVLIGVITAEMGRRADFYDHFNMIQRPPNTICMFVHGPSIANNRNQIIRAAIQNKMTHVFFLDDDVICKPDIIFQLLKHDKDIVCALQLNRNFPHRPYLFDEYNGDGKFKNYVLTDYDKGLIPIKASGFGAILIRTEIFLKLEEPWIRYNSYLPDQLGEDIDFYQRIMNKGVGTFCDLDCIVGHVASAVIWPNKTDKGWFIAYDTNGPSVISFLHTEQKISELV